MEKVCERIGYVRVSTTEQNSDVQKRQLLERGIPEDCIFIDKGVSGTIPAQKRPGFGRMIQYIEQHPGEIKCLVVYEISRLGRTTLETLNTINLIEKTHGVRVWSISPNELFTQSEDESIRQLMLMFMSWVAQRELANLRERTKEGIDNARAAGVIIGRPRKELDSATQQAVKQMREDGKEWQEIADELNIPLTRLYRWRKRAGGVTAKPRKNQPQKATGGD